MLAAYLRACRRSSICRECRCYKKPVLGHKDNKPKSAGSFILEGKDIPSLLAANNISNSHYAHQ